MPQNRTSGSQPVKQTPWDQRDSLGLFKALVNSIQKLVSSPESFFSDVDPSSAFGGELLYGVILGLLGMLPTYAWRSIYRVLSMSTEHPESSFVPLMSMLIGFVLVLIFAPLASLVWIFLGAAVVHLILMMIGAAEESFGATVKTVCYAQTANLANFIPMCGPLLSLVWIFYLEIVGLSTVHGISAGTAAVATLAPMGLVVLCCVLTCVGIVGLAFMTGGSEFWQEFQTQLQDSQGTRVIFFLLIYKQPGLIVR